MQNSRGDTHSLLIGYLTWLLGFLGSHRFYYGRPVSGTIYFFTFGLLGIGWIIDLFLMPSLDARADQKFQAGQVNYTIAWLLLTFFGVLGLHRFYLKKWVTGIIYILTGGLFLVGFLYDMWTLNTQISEMNTQGKTALI